MTIAEFPVREVTRDEFVALVTSNRPLVRVAREVEGVRELMDRETNERFRISERELYPLTRR